LPCRAVNDSYAGFDSVKRDLAQQACKSIVKRLLLISDNRWALGDPGSDYTPPLLKICVRLKQKNASAVVNSSTMNWMSKRSFVLTRKAQLHQPRFDLLLAESDWPTNLV
jgi:hypothetical protein